MRDVACLSIFVVVRLIVHLFCEVAVYFTAVRYDSGVYVLRCVG